MKKHLKKIVILYLLLSVVAMAGVFFTEKEDAIDEKVFLAMVAQGVTNEEEEALKARAIMLRTNLVGNESFVQLATATQLENWLKEDVTGQRYRNVKNAISQTEGMIMVFEKKVVFLPSHGISCGITRDKGEVTKEEYSYIQSASCKNDILAEGYLEVRKYSEKEVGGKLEIISRFDSGYVNIISVGDQRYSGEDFRKKMNLPSACFYIEEVDSGYRILTKGQGHGLGMSLNMANQLAKDGKNAMEILNYFFLGLSPALYEQGEVCPY